MVHHWQGKVRNNPVKPIMLFIIICASCITDAAFAQEVVENDTIRIDKDLERQIDLQAGKEVFLNPGLLDKSALSDSQEYSLKGAEWLKFDHDPATKLWIDHETVTLTPYHYSFSNLIEGLTMQGISGRFVFNDFLTANVNYFVSSTYFDVFQPRPYINNSLQTNLELKVHDRLYLVGLGGVSVREGLNPRMPTFLGGSNYFGGGVKIKVTDKVGFGFGVTRSYFRGNWTSRPYVVPVFFR
jgi:hypothetical protein